MSTGRMNISRVPVRITFEVRADRTVELGAVDCELGKISDLAPASRATAETLRRELATLGYDVVLADRNRTPLEDSPLSEHQVVEVHGGDVRRRP